MIYPLSNAIITQYFGEHPDDYLQYGFPGHNGIDLTTDDSTPVVYSVRPGRVVKVGWQADGYGKYIVIENGQYQYYYCHLASVFVVPGDEVNEGDPIGIMGSTGNSSGPHLHFGMRDLIGGGLIDYQGYINPWTTLSHAKQPAPVDITYLDLDDFTADRLANQVITIKPPLRQAKGKPVTHGKRTMFPRMKYF